MKTLYNAAFALLCTAFMLSMRAQDDVVELLHEASTVLQADAHLYSKLQFELDEISKEFDESAEMRRRLQCCVAYKFDFLNARYIQREEELLAIIAQKDQLIADLEERIAILEAESAAELDGSDEDVSALLYQVRDQYAAMEEQRFNFLAKLESLADKAYGHFEVEAIESTVFGEQTCGTLYCPELEDQSVEDAQEGISADGVAFE